MVKDLTICNHNVTYRIRRVYSNCPTAIVRYYSPERAYLIHENKKGFYICDVSFGKRYFDSEMNELLKSQGVRGVSEALERKILWLGGDSND